jgi:hypothetical protein
MFSNHDEVTIKLHTANNGHVWYSKGIGPASDSGQIVDEFMLSPVIAGMGLQIRVLGMPQNAELISALYLRRHKGEVRAVEVAGPQVLTADDTAEPKLVLLKMRAITLAAACGGWHPVSMLDYPTYAMMARMLRTNFVFDETANTYYHLHPAYRALSFIPTISPAEVAKLLTAIIDPRWYVDLRLPERTSKIELYLGLTPKIQARVSDPAQILKRAREFRCANVLACWKTVDPDTVDLAAPANFLYRIYRVAGGGTKGDLRASQAFVRYLRHNWLAGLENRLGVKDGLFAPDLFFKSPVEIESYAQHMATAKLT